MSEKNAWKPVDTSELIGSRWMRGLYRWVQPLVERRMGFTRVGEMYEEARELMVDDGLDGVATPGRFCVASLRRLGVEVVFAEGLVESLREMEGPVVVACNHPFGCLDAMGLMRLMELARPLPLEPVSDRENVVGWRILANRILRSIEELREVTLAVDPFATGEKKRENLRAMKEAVRFLKKGGMLGVFPGRRVSPLNEELGAVCDLGWSDHALKLAKAGGARVVVVHMAGQNSDEFLAVPVEQLARRSMMLAREIPRQVDRELVVSFGGLLECSEVERLLRKEDGVAQLRARCYGAAERGLSKVESDFFEKGEGLSEVRRMDEKVLAEVEGLRAEHSLLGGEKLSLFLFQGHEARALLEEVGRAREATFQVIGAGSGQEVDLSPEDEYYHHLVLWDEEERCLVGAYRIGFTREVIAARGVGGLYLDHVFEIDPAFYEEVGAGMELSRSFVLPKYQGDSRMLDTLWKGLGLAAGKMGCETLFGSVTISSSFSELSKAVLVETLERSYGDDEKLRGLVRARVPFVAKTKYHPLVAEAWREDGMNRLNTYIEELEGGRPIPPLMRYYVSLGAKFLSFHVEPTFNDAVYCLLRVQVSEMPKRYQKRFFGR